MDKISLIKKEIKDCKLYLNELYSCLKNEKDTKEIKNLNLEISANTYVKGVLSNLVLDYDNGTLESNLEVITKKNDIDYSKYCNSLSNDFSSEDYWKVKQLKNSLDIINERYLSKEEIYEYLYDYNKVMELARENIYVPIGNVFNNYMISTNQGYKANLNYYQKMIKIHLLFVSASILSVTKDEDFEYLWAIDEEIGEKTKVGGLSFLKDKFIIPTDASRFKKTHIFNFIRNAFFHSDNNELYKISTSCDYVFISLKDTNPIPFNVKISANDVFRMSYFVQNYSHHVSAFELENQDKLNIDNLFGEFHKCSKELDKVSLVRKVIDSDIEDRKEDINNELVTNNVCFSSSLFNSTLSKYGSVVDIKYNFSEEQKKLFHTKFKYFNKVLGNMGMEYFVVPIIVNYMPGGISKINFLYFDEAVSYTYLFNNRNSIFDIMRDISYDYMKLGNDNSYFDGKRTIFKFISRELDYSKGGLLYLFDDLEKKNFEDVLLFKYVYGSVNVDEKINIGGVEYLSSNIRNVFTHNRWRGFINDKGKRCFYLYDDSNILVDPDNAYWSATILYDDLRINCEDIMKKYKGRSNGLVKIKK